MVYFTYHSHIIHYGRMNLIWRIEYNIGETKRSTISDGIGFESHVAGGGVNLQAFRWLVKAASRDFLTLPTAL